MHFIFFPLSFIHFAIRPNVFTESWNFIVFELPCIVATICKSQATVSIFLAIFVVTFILGTIRPFLNSLAVLFIFKPVSYVCSSICMLVCSMSVSFIIVPLPFVNIPISMYESTMAIGLVSLPLTVILGTILPNLLTIAIFHAIEKFTCINCSIWESYRSKSLSLVVIHHLTSHLISTLWPSLELRVALEILARHDRHQTLIVIWKHRIIELSLR